MSKGPGKGKKFCPSCKNVCSAVVKQCPGCKKDFVKVIKAVHPEAQPGVRKMRVIPDGYEGYRIRATIFVPAGLCPVKLKEGAKESEITDWADKLRLHFLKSSQEWMLNHALCYYLRYNFDFHDKEYKRLCQIVNNLPDVKYIEVKPEEV